ncbi:hypothetical protein P4571_06495 [Niallia alba]|uniref:hypothetical protein n=1 Tax=Niallia alba TaxID=2729105 RepID=UPI002E1A6EDA|nr:hypothetical protein [Niallia alba]
MDEYLRKVKELNVALENEATKIVDELISNNIGKSTSKLKRDVLDFIRNNQLPEDMGSRVKQKVEDFILRIEIPAQKN